MKKYLMGLIAIVLAIGFSAFSPEANHARMGFTTYYAVRTGTGPLTWEWRTVDQIPMGFSCQTEIGGPTCTTAAESKPDDNSAPSGSSGLLYKQ